ncbi:MAG: DUF429 domain-containing protein [Planctomycetota bacterium]
MMTSPLFGIDACRGGWLVAHMPSDKRIVHVRVIAHMNAFERTGASPAHVAIDIPIGLPDAGRRACDVAARAALGHPRGTSVFPAPIRESLRATSREDASDITRAIDGRGVGAQAWNIVAKVREVDELLQSDPMLRSVLHEVHPELSFMAMNDGTAVLASKKTPEGIAARRELLGCAFGRDHFATSRVCIPRRDAADDDILDALAALWTAQRISRATSVALPDEPELDATGLPMQIVY